MEDEFCDFQNSFEQGIGHIYLFLGGFSFAKNNRQIFQQNDATEELTQDLFDDQRTFWKHLRNDCLDPSQKVEDIQSKTVFFLQKLINLKDLGFHNSTERRWAYHWHLANCH